MDGNHTAYRMVLGRSPSSVERERMVRFVEQQAKAGAGANTLNAAFADCCQVLLCLNEFVYVE